MRMNLGNADDGTDGTLSDKWYSLTHGGDLSPEQTQRIKQAIKADVRRAKAGAALTPAEAAQIDGDVEAIKRLNHADVDKAKVLLWVLGAGVLVVVLANRR